MYDQDPRAVSPNVIGIFGDEQKVELNILGGNLMKAQKMDLTDPDSVQQAGQVLVDSVMRGLRIQNKEWFRPGEPISPVFIDGFAERQRIVAFLKEVDSDADLNLLTSDSDRTSIKNAHVLKAEFEETDATYSGLVSRKALVEKFQHSVLSTPEISSEAQALRKDVLRQTRALGEVPPSDFHIQNMLMWNLVTHYILYRAPGLSVEPQDLVFLKSIWSDPESQSRSMDYIYRTMAELAEQYDIPAGDILTYTNNLLDRLRFTVDEETNISSITKSNTIAFRTADIASEVTRKHIKTRDNIVKISKNEIEGARATSDRYKQVKKSHEEALMSFDNDLAIPEDILEKYKAFFKDINPLDFLIIYSRSLNDWSESEEITQYTPMEKIIDSLKYLYASRVEFDDSSEAVSIFPRKEIEVRVADQIKEFLHLQILESNVSIAEYADRMPRAFLLDFFESHSFDDLTPHQQTAFLSIDNETWVHLCAEAGVGVNIGGSIMFPAGVDGLEDYIARLPPVKRDYLINRLKLLDEFNED